MPHKRVYVRGHYRETDEGKRVYIHGHYRDQDYTALREESRRRPMRRKKGGYY
jgi:hypothetical protein